MTFAGRAAAASLAVAAAAALGWLLLRPAPAPVLPERTPAPPPEPPSEAADARSPAPAPGAPEASRAPDAEAAPAPTAGAVPPGLRRPFGEDLSDPRVAEAKLRRLLAEEPPAWDAVASVAAVLPALPPDVRRDLADRLAKGEAGALRVFSTVRDPEAARDLLDALSTPRMRPADRTNVLEALASLPGADRDAVVLGIEARLFGDPTADAAALRAIAARGGPEAARVLVEATARAPQAFDEGAWRRLDVSDPATAARLAEALRDGTRDPAARRALAVAAGRPGAPAPVVLALLALDDPGHPPEVRDAALAAIARTGAPEAVERLLRAAEEGGPRGETAARAFSEMSGARGEAGERLVRASEEAKDPVLRRHLARALGGVPTDAARAALERLLGDGDDLVRKEAIVALGRAGPRAADSVPALARAFDEGDDVAKGHVALTLASIGTPEARRTLEQMRAASSSPAVRRQVALAIESLGRR
jgi:HEAT repeat protein